MAEFFDIVIVGGGPAGSTAGTLLVPAVNSVLAGSEQHMPEIRWRLWVFDFLVFLQKRFALIAPRMNLSPDSK